MKTPGAEIPALAGLGTSVESAGSSWVTAGHGDPLEGVRAATLGAWTVGPGAPPFQKRPPPPGTVPGSLPSPRPVPPLSPGAPGSSCRSACALSPSATSRPSPAGTGAQSLPGAGSQGCPAGAAPEAAGLIQAQDAPGHPDLIWVASKIRSKKRTPEKVHIPKDESSLS